MIADDPVFAAIERHRQATQALSELQKERQRAMCVGFVPPDALVEQLHRAEEDAFLAWLTTPPTTMPGVIATLAYASYRPPDSGYANLAESTQYFRHDVDDPDDILKAGEQFPAMIAEALQKIAGS